MSRLTMRIARSAPRVALRLHVRTLSTQTGALSPAELGSFRRRHVGPREGEDTQRMLSLLGFESLDAMMDSAVPSQIRSGTELDDLPAASSESEALAELRELAKRNKTLKSYIGMGYYGCHTPSVVLRNMLENPAWYTAYTPYQAEISQGRMEMLLNFQTMVSDLTALPIATCSLLDEASAAAESMQMCHAALRGKRSRFFVAADCHPQTIACVQTRAEAFGVRVEVADPNSLLELEADALREYCGVLIQYPNTFGAAHDFSALAEALHGAGAKLVAATDLLACTQLVPPGALGADIVVGSAQRFGVPMFYGGPHAGFMTTTDALKRLMPGRLIGVSRDSQGKPALRMALQAREQFIRREKAGSNICTAQALLANVAAAYAVYHGPDGLRAIGARVHALAAALAEAAAELGYMMQADGDGEAAAAIFDTVSLGVPAGFGGAPAVLRVAEARGINLRDLEEFGAVGASVDETTTEAELRTLIGALAEAVGARGGDAEARALVALEAALARGHSRLGRLERASPVEMHALYNARWLNLHAFPAQIDLRIPCSPMQGPDQISAYKRRYVDRMGDDSEAGAFLEHPVFNTHHSETQMLRYLTSLEKKDLTLRESMIALGSCTMKLNATSELMPISWPEFTDMHPYAPASQSEGYHAMIDQLNGWFAQITGFAAVSTQPNSGATGEYAGLLAIRAYHETRGERHRNVCLIPVSAHGTNGASASMCGMKVVVLKCTEDGDLDSEDLKAKVAKHRDELGALMVTYPSTFGKFEEGIKETIDTVHEAGGLVYMDGANLNAQIGVCSPGALGADVCHLNLHKTFCIPHGGGGPGVGSIGVAKRLAPFLPGHAVVPCGGEPVEGENTQIKTSGQVAAAPFGSAGILPISWMYVRMMGGDGLFSATKYAVLNANYMAKRLEDHYDVLFRGERGQCAHEFILDCRPFKKHGIDEMDIAKRLADYGFHAPTTSWPLVGSMMVEPTESEDLAELDRLCDALIAIRGEIKEVENGTADAADNVLKNSPHTAEMVCADEWPHPYSRETAAYPAPWLRQRGKFWPSVGRVDNVFGDRNLVCTCPPMESYQE